MHVLLRTLTAAALFLATPVLAHDFKTGSLQIDHPWSRATPKGASVGAGYLVIENRGSTADRFLSVIVSPDIAGRTEIHEMAVTDGVMRMRPLPKGAELAPGKTVKFEPGGLHVMFMELKRPLEKGQRIKATLVFEKADKIDVEFVVEAMGGSGGGAASNAKGHHGH
jgi:copper(I)-binding protein